ncbi:hypothetical protein LTSEJOH_2185 [Salmonella enterica subsp. enterica serovar Johannesburg str. S5-703]|nr:hypothetical protein LTSEJOH_2185 [Salmonella enterica subsp. enterica serovar Johannesburg str. S5-703]
MANWLNQLQSLLGQKGASASPSGEQGLNKLLVPGALGGLAGLLVANKSSRKLLTKYGTGALLVGGGAVAGSVLWNKYKDKVRAAHQGEPQFGSQSTPLDVRTERLILALVFAAKRLILALVFAVLQKAMGILMPKNARRLSTNCENQVLKSKGVCLSKKLLSSRLIHNVWHRAFAMKKKPWKSTS